MLYIYIGLFCVNISSARDAHDRVLMHKYVDTYVYMYMYIYIYMYIYVYIYIYVHIYLTFSTDSTEYTYQSLSRACACARALSLLLSLFLPRSFSLSLLRHTHAHTHARTHSLTPIHPLVRTLSLVSLLLFSHAIYQPHPANYTHTPPSSRSVHFLMLKS